MPCYKIIASHLLRFFKQVSEFEAVIAFYTGIGSAPELILTYKGLDNTLPEFILIVKNMIRYADSLTNTSGVLCVFERTACVEHIKPDRIIFIQAHCAADTVITRVFHKQSGDSRVNAAAHGNKSFHQ